MHFERYIDIAFLRDAGSVFDSFFNHCWRHKLSLYEIRTDILIRHEPVTSIWIQERVALFPYLLPAQSDVEVVRHIVFMIQIVNVIRYEDRCIRVACEFNDRVIHLQLFFEVTRLDFEIERIEDGLVFLDL